MKSRYLFFIVLGSLLLSCNNDDLPYAEVPSVVVNKLLAEYPHARDPDFRQSGENYEVEFEIKEKDHEALISPEGKLVGQKKEISWTALPSEVQETLRKEYGEKDIKDVELVTIGEEVYYQAEVKRFLADEKIVLNNAGERNPALNYWK